MKTIKTELLDIHQITAEVAARILGLPDDDPTVALYQGIAFFENNQVQQAFDKFMFAACHYQLHAIPYIQEMIKMKLVTPDATTQEKLLHINQWADWLSQVRVDHTEFFLTSKASIKLNKLSTPSVTSKKSTSKKKNPDKERKKILKEFLANNTSSGHLLYHQAFLQSNPNKKLEYFTSAASNGHLLAVAYFTQGIALHGTTTFYCKKICSIAFHRQSALKTYASRLYYTALSSAETSGKKSLHFEVVRLGMKHAFYLIAKLYFIDHKDFVAAAPLIALGITLQEPHARYAVVHLIDHLRSCALTHFELTTESIIQYICLNFTQELEIAEHPTHDESFLRTLIKTNSAHGLKQIIKTQPLENDFYTRSGLLPMLIELVEKEHNLTNAILTIYLRMAKNSSSPQDQIIYKQHSI